MQLVLQLATYLPTITSSVTFSMMAAASPATSASNTGALYKFQNKNSSPRLAVVLPTCPKRLAWGFQNVRSKHSTTLLRLPNPSLWIADVFQSGNDGTNWMVFNCPLDGAMANLSTPSGRVQRATSAEKRYKCYCIEWEDIRVKSIVSI